MTDTPLFVARDRQLVELNSALDGVLAGNGCVRFVVGEAGSGKTALVREFSRRAQSQHEEVLVAVGQSDAQTGIGDPFLPFRELLGQLTGDVDAKLAQGGITEENAGRLRRFLGFSGQAIVDFGPDLIGAFIPGVGLATRAATYAARKSGHLDKLDELTQRQEAADRGGIDQSNIFEQYTNVITRMAEEQPLVLILDDLQWADAASAGLLFRLGRSVADSRVLLVGTYRPAEVAIGRGDARHPLEKVLAEFKRYFGDVAIDLGDVPLTDSRRLVDEVLDAEPNRLSDEFRHALFDHTGGHPLFTIELLRALQDRGDLVHDDEGRWVEGPYLDWDTLPARVEGVIEERIGRLDDNLHETLTVASVEGEDFTAEVVAQVQSVEPRHLVRRLGHDLERQHRLIRSRGVRDLEGNGRRLSMYSFHHNLFQRYLYLDLDDADRAYLHEDVGLALEALCAESPDEFVVQLARHFFEADITDKAVAYLRRAGELSFARYANDEAVDYFTRALALVPEFDRENRWDILEAREAVLGLMGDRGGQAADLDQMGRLADQLGDDEKRSEVALRAAAHDYATCDYPQAIERCKEAIGHAASGRDTAREARAWVEWGYSVLEQGKQDEAQRRLEYALALTESAALHQLQPRVLNGLARIHSERGEFEEASAGYREALLICQRLGDVQGEAKAVNSLGILSGRQGALTEAIEYFNQALERETRIGNRRGVGRVLHNLGEASADDRDFLTARKRYRESLRITAANGDQSTECANLSGLGNVAAKLGLIEEAQDYLHRSLDISTRIDQRLDIADALAWLARVDWVLGQYSDSSDRSREALGIAREFGDPLLEGRALDLLGRSFEGLEAWDDAAAAHEQAFVVRRESGQDNPALESEAGQARVALARGDIAAAQAHVESIVAHVVKQDLGRMDSPLLLYLTCYQVLEVSGDDRAPSVLADAHDILKDQMAGIDDPDVRRAFCENVPTNRQLLELLAERAQPV